MTLEELIGANTAALQANTAALLVLAKPTAPAAAATPAAAAPAAPKPAAPAAATPVAPKPAEPTPAAEQKAAAAAGVKKVTVDDVRSALRNAAEKHGREAAKELLTKRGVEAVADLKEEHFQVVIDEAANLSSDGF